MQDREAAFLSLISEHNGIIHKISRLYRDSPEDREDLFQEINLSVVENRILLSGAMPGQAPGSIVLP